MFEHDRPLDQIVPKFSLLADARVTPLVLIGVWVIFAPVTIGAAAAMVSCWNGNSDLFTSLLGSVLPLFVVAVGMAILWRTTRRYMHRASYGAESDEGPSPSR